MSPSFAYPFSLYMYMKGLDDRPNVHPEAPYIRLETMSNGGIKNLLLLTCAVWIAGFAVSYVYTATGFSFVPFRDTVCNQTLLTNCTRVLSSNVSQWSGEADSQNSLSSFASFSVLLYGTNVTVHDEFIFSVTIETRINEKNPWVSVARSNNVTGAPVQCVEVQPRPHLPLLGTRIALSS